MIILGLTGSIGMGKSAAAAGFRRVGVPVFDADKIVHGLLAEGGEAVTQIGKIFPNTVKGPAIDRYLMAGEVFCNPEALTRLESILHPMVRCQERKFLEIAARRRQRLVVLDVPLLYETEGEARCDAVVTVSAPVFIQERRVLKRPGMTQERMKSILTRQMPNGEKCRRADFVVLTGLGRDFSLRQILNIVRITSKWWDGSWSPRRGVKGK